MPDLQGPGRGGAGHPWPGPVRPRPWHCWCTPSSRPPPTGGPPARSLAGFAVSAVLLTAFIVGERRAADPMLDVRLFRNMRFSAASGAVTVSFFTLFGFIFLITQYFQFIRGYSPLQAGVRLLPVALSVGAGSVAGTQLAVRAGTKLIVTTGLVAMAGFYAWVALTTSTTLSYGIIAVQMVVYGLGMGLTSAPATESIMGAIARTKAGVGSAVNDSTRLIGGTLGVAVIGSIYASVYGSRLTAPCPPPHRARSRPSPTSPPAPPTRPPASSPPPATQPSPWRSSTRPPTRSCAASPPARSSRAASPRPGPSSRSCSYPPSPPGPGAPWPMRPERPKAAALPRPRRIAPQRSPNPVAADCRPATPPHLTDTEGITAMAGPITRHRDIESLKTAASWPGADRNTTVVLAIRLAAAHADAEGYRYFSGLADAQPGEALPLAIAGFFQGRLGDDVDAALAKLDEAAAADLGPPQYFRGLALAGLPPDRRRAEQAVADLEFVLAVRDEFPADAAARRVPRPRGRPRHAGPAMTRPPRPSASRGSARPRQTRN